MKKNAVSVKILRENNIFTQKLFDNLVRIDKSPLALTNLCYKIRSPSVLRLALMSLARQGHGKGHTGF